MPIPAHVLEILRCPACRAVVQELPDGAGIACTGCRRVYPIVDGIPSMLVESARIPEA
jgi:uncharacterized protein YbaR (Trm112 family)